MPLAQFFHRRVSMMGGELMNCILTLAASCVLLSGEAQNYSPRLAQSDCLVDCNSKLSACSFDCGWGIGGRSDVCRTRLQCLRCAMSSSLKRPGRAMDNNGLGTAGIGESQNND